MNPGSMHECPRGNTEGTQEKPSGRGPGSKEPALVAGQQRE
jgi:hypothetical protein